MLLPKYFFVFDVESIGLHGEGFAVAWVVIDAKTSERVDERAILCSPDSALGTGFDRQWIEDHVIHHLEPLGKEDRYPTPRDVRGQFWIAWLHWRERGAWMAADVCWPVEARFLFDCVHASGIRKSAAPYPLIDIASARLAVGLDPISVCERLSDERPAHHPLADSRQSARLLIEALEKGGM